MKFGWRLHNLKVTYTVDKGVREVVDTVVAMDDSVASVDNKVAEVIADVKKAKLSTHKTAKGIDQVQRNQLRQDFADGSVHRIPPQTITSRTVLTMRELRRGFFRVIFSKNGSPLVPFFGFTANPDQARVFFVPRSSRTLDLRARMDGL